MRQRRGRSGGVGAGPGAAPAGARGSGLGARSPPRLGCPAGPAQAAAPPNETPRTAQGSGASAALLVREKTPEPWRVNFSSSQAPVHIGEHRQNLLRTTARPRHGFHLQPQVRWICQKTTKGCDVNAVYIVYSRGENRCILICHYFADQSCTFFLLLALSPSGFEGVLTPRASGPHRQF